MGEGPNFLSGSNHSKAYDPVSRCFKEYISLLQSVSRAAALPFGATEGLLAEDSITVRVLVASASSHYRQCEAQWVGDVSPLSQTRSAGAALEWLHPSQRRPEAPLQAKEEGETCPS